MWSTEMLESYLDYLETAQKNDRNPVAEKYARMDNLKWLGFQLLAWEHWRHIVAFRKGLKQNSFAGISD